MITTRDSEKFLDGLVSEGIILPSQIFTQLYSTVNSEKALMVAVLEEAVKDYQKYAFMNTGSAQKLFRVAQEYIFSDDRGWLFSFCNICDALGIDGSYLKSGLTRWLLDAQRLQQEQVTALALELAMSKKESLR